MAKKQMQPKTTKKKNSGEKKGILKYITLERDRKSNPIFVGVGLIIIVGLLVGSFWMGKENKKPLPEPDEVTVEQSVDQK